MHLIIAYMKNGELPENKTKSKVLRLKAARYINYDDKIYMRGYSIPFLKCVMPSEAYYIMREIHEGLYGNHAWGVIGVQDAKTRLLLANNE